jgi:uncharacterized protein YceK
MACFFLSGCASVVARVFGENYSYYHGTQFDAENAFDKPLSPILLIDLPFSFVMDTLLLPVDLIYSPYCGVLSSARAPGNEKPQCIDK